jgi:hypothetical protein
MLHALLVQIIFNDASRVMTMIAYWLWAWIGAFRVPERTKSGLEQTLAISLLMREADQTNARCSAGFDTSVESFLISMMRFVGFDGVTR